MSIEFLHTMVRVTDVDASLKFYCDGLGLEQVRRVDNDKGRFTLVFLASPADVKRLGGVPDNANPTQLNIPMIELTHNWDPEVYQGGRNFGHLAYMVDDIYAAVERLAAQAVGQRREHRRLVEIPCRMHELR